MKTRLTLSCFSLIFFQILTCACSETQGSNIPSRNTTPSSTSSHQNTTTPEIDRSSPIAPTLPHNAQLDQSPITELIDYFLEVSLDYESHFLSISQVIDYTNNTGVPLSELPLIVPPAYVQNAFDLLSISTNRDGQNEDIQILGSNILIPLDPPLGVDKNLQINLAYQLHPPDAPAAFGFTPRQMLLADWYPFVPRYTESDSWLINQPGLVGEYLVYPLSNVTANIQIVTNQSDLVVAASAHLLAKEDNNYQYSARSVRNFSLALSSEYHVITHQNGNIEISTYTFPEHVHLAERATLLALEAWETFRELYGDNKRNFLSIVESQIPDGLETDGLIYLSDWYFESADRTPKNYFELLIVHETAHQWFFGLISNDQAKEPWLDETLATFSELLFYEKHYPNLVSWWWEFRVNMYDPEGFINSSIYEFTSYRPYVNTIYLQGARFMKHLRETIGDSAFKLLLYQYVQFNGDDFRNTEFFFNRLAEITNVEFDTIIRDYFQ
jgi:hypothetical protein